MVSLGENVEFPGGMSGEILHSERNRSKDFLLLELWLLFIGDVVRDGGQQRSPLNAPVRLNQATCLLSVPIKYKGSKNCWRCHS